MKLQSYCQISDTSSGPAPRAINKHRICKSPDCSTALTIYNHSDYCFSCQEKREAKKLIRRETPVKKNMDSSGHRVGTCETCGAENVNLVDYHDCSHCWWPKYKMRRGLSKVDRGKIQTLITEGKSNHDIAAFGFEMRHIEYVRGMNGRRAA